MNKISVLGLGLAFGGAFALYYLGCVLIMAVIGQNATIFFFNSLLHGLDTTSIIRMNVPIIEQIIGFIFTFALGWVFGVMIAFFYNVMAKKA